MENETYLNVMGLLSTAFGNEIVADSNKKDLADAFEFIHENRHKNQNAVWIITPYECKV